MPSERTLHGDCDDPWALADRARRTIRYGTQKTTPRRQETPTVTRPANGPVHTPTAASSLTSPPPTPDLLPPRAESAAAASMTASTLRQPSSAPAASGAIRSPASTPATMRATPEQATAKTQPFGMILQLRSVAEATPSAAASVAKHTTPSTADKTSIVTPSPEVRGILGNLQKAAAQKDALLGHRATSMPLFQRTTPQTAANLFSQESANGMSWGASAHGVEDEKDPCAGSFASAKARRSGYTSSRSV